MPSTIIDADYDEIGEILREMIGKGFRVFVIEVLREEEPTVRGTYHVTWAKDNDKSVLANILKENRQPELEMKTSAGTKQDLAYRWIDEYTRDKGAGWSLLPHDPRTQEEYTAVFDRFVKDGYKIYAEFKDGRHYIYVKRGQ